VRVHVSLFWWTWTIYESEVSSINWVWEPQWLHSWPRASLDFRSTCSHMIFKKALLSRVWQYFGDHSIISCMCAVCTHVIVWHTRRHIHIHIHAWSNYHVIWMYYAAYDFFLKLWPVSHCKICVRVSSVKLQRACHTQKEYLRYQSRTITARLCMWMSAWGGCWVWI
jgi:hypothetical protein